MEIYAKSGRPNCQSVSAQKVSDFVRMGTVLDIQSLSNIVKCKPTLCIAFDMSSLHVWKLFTLRLRIAHDLDIYSFNAGAYDLPNKTAHTQRDALCEVIVLGGIGLICLGRCCK